MKNKNKTRAIGSYKCSWKLEPAQRRGLTHGGPRFSLDDICVSWNNFVSFSSVNHLRMCRGWCFCGWTTLSNPSRGVSLISRLSAPLNHLGVKPPICTLLWAVLSKQTKQLQPNVLLYGQLCTWRHVQRGKYCSHSKGMRPAVGVSTSCSVFYACRQRVSWNWLALDLPVIH